MKIPAFARLLASVTALSLAASALAQENGSVSTFELPSDQATPRGQAQGPVVDGVAPPRVVRTTPTPAPTPVVIEAQPVPIDPGASTPQPQPSADAVSGAIDNFGAARPRPSPSASAAPGVTATSAPTSIDAIPSTVATAQPSITLPQAADEQAPASATVSTGGLQWWMWLAIALAVGIGGTALGWVWRGRRTPAQFEVEAIEPPGIAERPPEPSGPPAELPPIAARTTPPRPVPQPQPAPAPAAAPMPTPARAPLPLAVDEDHDEETPERPLRIALEPARLSVSLLNATLAYRILLTNQGDIPLRDISIDGDMISAHASLSQEEQLAAPNSQLENRHLIRTLFPGETKVVSGNFALPLPLIRPIRNGEAALFVPLARLRVVAGGERTEMIVQTSVVGQRSPRPGGGLQPFRLDLGPRVYSELGQRAFA